MAKFRFSFSSFFSSFAFFLILFLILNPHVRVSASKAPVENEDDYESEETVYAEPAEAAPGPQSGPPPAAKPAPIFGAFEQEHYYLEMAAGVFIVLYVINFFLGRRFNEKYATAWLHQFRDIFEAQFHAVGLYAPIVPSDAPADLVDVPIVATGGLLKDSQSCFKYYASGRRFCHSLLATLDLKKRQDLFSLALSFVDITSPDDFLLLEIPMNDSDMESFVFAIVRKKHEKKMRKQNKDLENYSSPVKSARLGNNWCVLTDCPELEAEFIDTAVATILKESEDLFVWLHFSDESQSSSFHSGVGGLQSPENKKILKFKFKMPPLADLERLRNLIQMSIKFIDLVASKKLSPQAKARAASLRKAVKEKLWKSQHQQRQEAIKQKKEEQRRKDEEKPAPVLSPEAQRKKAQKEHKEMMKKRAPRVKILR